MDHPADDAVGVVLRVREITTGESLGLLSSFHSVADSETAKKSVRDHKKKRKRALRIGPKRDVSGTRGKSRRFQCFP